MTKTKIANIPFGPYITVLAGATVKGKPNYTTIGAYNHSGSVRDAIFGIYGLTMVVMVVNNMSGGSTG